MTQHVILGMLSSIQFALQVILLLFQYVHCGIIVLRSLEMQLFSYKFIYFYVINSKNKFINFSSNNFISKGFPMCVLHTGNTLCAICGRCTCVPAAIKKVFFYHKYFSHKYFSINFFFKYFLAILSILLTVRVIKSSSNKNCCFGHPLLLIGS